ncbi:MAG: phage major capsid protein [Candidatus Nanopelagicales bacterium]
MSHALIKTLAEKRQNIWNESRALLDKAEAEKRDLTAEENEVFERQSADLTALRGRIDSIETTMRENDEAEAAEKRLLGDRPEQRGDDNGGINEELRAFLKGETRSMAFDADGKVWSRALSKGTATAGGNTVPTSFYDQMVEHLVDTTSVLQAGATVLNTSSGENIDVPVTTSHGAAAAVAEAGTLAGTDPAVAKRILGAFKFGQLIKLSRELVDDTAVDLLGYVSRAAGRNVGLALGAKLAVGAGTTEPWGIVTRATTGVTGGAGVTGAFTADNLIDLMFSVIGPYRTNGSWLVKDATLGSVRKLKDSANRYLFDPAATFGQPDTLLGRPIYTDANMASVGLSAKSVLFGDISTYFVRIAGGVRFERSDDFAFDSDQVAFRAIIRADGELADQTGSVKLFVGNAA